jgi:hypothetical protein
MNDERDRARDGPPPPTAPAYLYKPEGYASSFATLSLHPSLLGKGGSSFSLTSHGLWKRSRIV